MCFLLPASLVSQSVSRSVNQSALPGIAQAARWSVVYQFGLRDHVRPGSGDVVMGRRRRKMRFVGVYSFGSGMICHICSLTYPYLQVCSHLLHKKITLGGFWSLIDKVEQMPWKGGGDIIPIGRVQCSATLSLTLSLPRLAYDTGTTNHRPLLKPCIPVPLSRSSHTHTLPKALHCAQYCTYLYVTPN